MSWFNSNVFLGGAQRKLMDRGATIFTYHKIGSPPGRSTDPFLYTTVGEFERQLSLLHAAHCTPLTLDSALAAKAVSKPVVITFDDGFRNVFENGLPALARHKMPAIQFIVSGSIGKENHWDVAKRDVPEPLMDAAQIKEWLAAGNQIGSHSVTHRNLKKLDAAEAREEIIASKKFLEDTFGVEVRHFCYPFGGWTTAVRDIVAGAGYATACGVEFGVNGADADRFALLRIIPLSRADLMRKILHRLLRKLRGQ
jgi:peptidoglycan/xylan/chitin deacetylase (PgdA/CDA1 family)